MQNIFKIILTYRKYFLLGVAVISLWMIWGISRLSVSYDFDSYFAKKESFYQDFERIGKEYSLGQNLQIVVSLEAKKDLDLPFAKAAHHLFEQIERLPGIDRAVYFSNLKEVDFSQGLPRELPMMDLKNEATWQSSYLYLQQRKAIYGPLLSKDSRSLVAYFTIAPNLFNDPKRDELVKKIQSLAGSSSYKSHVFGIPVMRSSYSEKVLSDFLFFSIASIVLLLVVLYYLFRNWTLVFLPCLTIVLGIIWTFGLMSWTGFSMNMITNLLVPILFVVGISDAIHLISVYYEKMQLGLSREETLLESMKEVGKATFLTALVSSLGFLSLAATSVDAIKYFGVFGCVGIIVTYVLSIIIVPTVLLWLDLKSLKISYNLISQGFWHGVFDRVYQITQTRRVWIVGIFLSLVVVSLSLIPRINTNLLSTSDVKDTDPLAKEFTFFEEQVSYVKPFEFEIRAKGPLNVALLKQLEAVEGFLLMEGKFGTFQSILFQLRYANYLLHQRKMEYFTLPQTEASLQFLLRGIRQMEVPLFYKEASRSYYFAGKIKDEGSVEMGKLELRLRQHLEQKFSFEVLFTGFGHVLDQSNISTRKEIFYGLFGDLVLVSLLMAFLFKNVKFVWISLIPNVIPLLVLLGIIAFFQIPFSPANALILVVIFGISIDDTIHFLTHYLIIRKEERPVRSTLITCGKAMLFVSFILMAGLGVTYFSDFQAISSLGLFGMITIIFATLTEFFLTPILITLFDPQVHE